jgi:hypothetical protein
MSTTAAELDEIFALESDDDLIAALYDHVNLEASTRGEAALSPEERAVLAVWWLEAEVNNGGFDQWFFNSAGDRAAFTVEALRWIGALTTADITARAIAVFAAPPSTDRETRSIQMTEWGGSQRAVLEALDREFYAYPDRITPLLAAFCRGHSASFRSPPNSSPSGITKR